MKLRLARPATLVDIGRLDDLRGVRDAGDHLAIGGLTRHRPQQRPGGPALPTLISTRPGWWATQVRHRGDRRLAARRRRRTCRPSASPSTP
jgi:carbon-monoxide dehydrogenase medium subunit